MNDRDEGRRVSRLIGGGLLLLVGTLLMLHNFGVVRTGRLGDYWPLVLVWIGLTRVFGPNRSDHFASGLVLLCLGVFFQLDRLDWIDVSVDDFWPVFAVAAGVAMILEGLRGRRAASGRAAPGASESGGRP